MANSNLPSNLPVVSKKSLPAKIKDGLADKKTKKLIYATATVAGIGALIGLTPIISTASTAVGLSSIAVAGYGALGLVKNTVIKSYNDLAFVVRNKKDTIKLGQDPTRVDLMLKMIGKTKADKVAFLQLQAIVGLSKIDSLPKEFQDKPIETDTHGVVTSTFKKLEKIGAITELNINPKTNVFGRQKKTSHFIEKMAMGNFNVKDLLINKEKIDTVSFIPQKKIDINDKNLREAFPFVFGKEGSKKNVGILAKYGWKIARSPDGSLSIDYGTKQHQTVEQEKVVTPGNTERETFLKYLKSNTFTLDKQAKFSEKYKENINDKHKNNDEYLEP